MPKFFQYKVAGYYLYYTTFCIVECFHAHASDGRLTETSSAKFFIRNDGSSVIQRKGALKNKEIRFIQRYIKEHYLEMYDLWKENGGEGFYRS